MTVTAEELSLPRLALEIAVDQLTRPEVHRVSRDDGTHTRAELPSLLEQLEAAREANSGRGGAFVARSKPPLWIDAVSLLEEIGLEVRHYGRPDYSLVSHVRAWAGAMHSLTELEAFEAVVTQAEEWVRRARSLLDPDPPTPLEGACPQCGRAWVEAVNDENENVRRRALRGTERPALAWCEACASRWEGEALWLLADALRAQTQVETYGQEPV